MIIFLNTSNGQLEYVIEKVIIYNSYKHIKNLEVNLAHCMVFMKTLTKHFKSYKERSQYMERHNMFKTNDDLAW